MSDFQVVDMAHKEKDEVMGIFTLSGIVIGFVVGIVISVVKWGTLGGGWPTWIPAVIRECLGAVGSCFISVAFGILAAAGSGGLYLIWKKKEEKRKNSERIESEKKTPRYRRKQFARMVDRLDSYHHLSDKLKLEIKRLSARFDRLKVLTEQNDDEKGRDVGEIYRRKCHDTMDKVIVSVLGTVKKWGFWHEKQIPEDKIIHHKIHAEEQLAKLSSEFVKLIDKTEDILVGEEDDWGEVEATLEVCTNLASRIKDDNLASL